MLEQQLFDEVLKLPPITRLDFIEKILISASDLEFWEEWKVEIEKRIKDYESGLIKTIPAEQVFAKYGL
jgi:putative addiction module component (TIGR02574 family)